MSNVMVHVDRFFKEYLLKMLTGKIEQFNLNDLTIWSLSWIEDEETVYYTFCLHPDSLTTPEMLEAGRIIIKKRPNNKEKEWMRAHNKKGYFFIINSGSKKEKEALEQFCHENKIPLTREDRPKNYNLTWW